MATTVAQHSVATFTSPVNGTTPIDANTVRGNDNTTRAAYNDHDADPGIHVQSSSLASRPVAGTAGRKWITEDSGVYTLWFDDGTNWHPVSSENVALTVLAGENLVKGDVVKVTGWNNGQDLPEVVKTTSAADTAFAVITATVSSGSMGYATNTGIVQDVNTAAYSVGTILYANGSGGFTSTKPTSGNYQPVAYVLRANASNGVYYVEFSTPRIVERSDNTASTVVLRDSNGDFSAGTITATAVNATTLDLTNLEVTNIKAKDGTQAIAIADTTGKLTISDGVLLSALTASQAVFTDGSKNLVSNAITGTGNVVMSASPTLTGTVTAATLNATTLGGTLSTAAQPNVTSVGTLSSLTVSGDLTVDTSTLKVDSTNNRVGIGTASPSYALHVQNSSANTDAFIGQSSTTGLFWQWRYNATTANAYGEISTYGGNNPLYIQTQSGSGNTILNFNGNVGIGTASPATKLEVNGAARLGADGASVSLYSTTGWRHTGTGGLYIDANQGGAANVVVIRNGSGFASQLTLDGSGNLGLGVTPSAWTSTWRSFDILGGSLLNSNTLDLGLASNAYYNGTNWIYKNNGPATNHFMDGTGVFQWNGAGSGTAGNAITFVRRMTLDASGNLGVGTTSPQVLVEFSKATTDATVLQEVLRISTTGRSASGGTANRGTLLSFSDSANQTVVGSVGGLRENSAANWGGALAFYTNGIGSPSYGVSTLTERARIDSSGNLGVGTSSPSGAFHVVKSGTYAYQLWDSYGAGYHALIDFRNSRNSTAGSYTATNSGDNLLLMRAYGTNSGNSAFAHAASISVLQTSTAGATYNPAAILFSTSDGSAAVTERARITSGGYTKHSNDGTYVDASGSYHEFRNTADAQSLIVSNTNASFGSQLLDLYTTRNTTNGSYNVIRYYNTTAAVARFIVADSGNVTNTNGSYGTISDLSLKQDIVDAPSQWDDIKAVRFRKYRLKSDVAADETAPYLLGVVAQELEQVSPGLVEGSDVKAVKSSILLMKAAVALQEAMARIETLEQRVLALEA